VLRTDELGVIVVRSDGRRVEVEANDARWTVPAVEARTASDTVREARR
jgi:hypothetical protein